MLRLIIIATTALAHQILASSHIATKVWAFQTPALSYIATSLDQNHYCNASTPVTGLVPHCYCGISKTRLLSLIKPHTEWFCCPKHAFHAKPCWNCVLRTVWPCSGKVAIVYAAFDCGHASLASMTSVTSLIFLHLLHQASKHIKFHKNVPSKISSCFLETASSTTHWCSS